MLPIARRTATLLPLALVGGLLLLLVSLSTAGPADAANACARWGDKRPAHLSTPHARAAIRCLVNRRRASHGVHTLDGDRRLTRSAQRHSGYMDRHRCFSHDCPGEPSLYTRLRKVGYLVSGLRSWAYGENIAWGRLIHGTPERVVRAWMRSAPHRATMLDSSFRDLGVGFAHGSPYDGDDGAAIYTIDFGLRRR
jgi:uncharacterized protein YkwD